MFELPGLRGDDALGFLAALGLVALSEQGALPALRLAWAGGSAPEAVVEGDVSSRDELADRLDDAFACLRAEDRAAPRLEADFPWRKQGSGSDPMRMAPARLSELARRAAGAWLKDDNPWPARWLLALSTQTQVTDPKRGDVVLTPFYAPSGQMSLRVSLWDKTAAAVEAVEGPRDALTGWRRTDYDGANFDHRAKRDAAVTTWGKAANQGAPSSTWLAVMAMWLFPLVEQPGGVRSVGWQRVRLYPSYTHRSLVWPVWAPPLDVAAVRTLLAHPALKLRRSASGTWQPSDSEALAGLGVRAMFGSSRSTLSQGDGPLGPTVRLWHDPSVRA